MKKWIVTCNWCPKYRTHIQAVNLGEARKEGKKLHNHNTKLLYLNLVSY